MGMDEISTMLSNNVSDSGFRVISLAFGQSDFPVWEHINFDFQAAEMETNLHYGDTQGEVSLRKKISDFYASNFNIDSPATRILITDGATGALALTLGMLVSRGDEVIIPEVGYAAYSRIIAIFGGVPIPAPLDENFNLDVRRLPDLITSNTAAIIVNSPGNPHGNISDLSALAEMASLGIPAIFDEVYQCATFDGVFAPSATQLPEQHFVINSFSKAFAAPGLRMGFVIVPSRYAEAARSMKVSLNICPNRLGQVLAEQLLDHSRKILRAHSRYLKRHYDIFLNASSTLSLPVIDVPQAGFYGMIQLPEHIDSMTAGRTLAVDYAVGTAPGIDFSEKDPGFLRVNITVGSKNLKEALARMASALQKMTHN